MPEETENSTPVQDEKKTSIQPGNYKLVGWDMSITGKLVSDEICQISGYTAESKYSQYVMPYKDLSQSAKLRFGLKVVTISRYRMLKDTKVNKIIKSKSEISALTEFITWLENVKGSSDGIILVYHENRQILPSILLESLKKYSQLYDQFTAVVKGFINGCNVAKANSKYFNNASSMRTLARNFLNKTVEDNDLSNATVRAELGLQILEHFITVFDGEKKNISDCDPTKIFECIHNYVETISDEETIHAALKAIHERENSLTPVFNILRTGKGRQQIFPLRKLLAESEIELTQLEQAWKDNKKEGLEKLMNEKIKNPTPKELQRLLSILECYFDEDKAKEFNLNLDADKDGKITRKKRNRFTKKMDTTVNNDSGNDSGDNTHSPSKLDISVINNSEVQITA